MIPGPVAIRGLEIRAKLGIRVHRGTQAPREILESVTPGHRGTRAQPGTQARRAIREIPVLKEIPARVTQE